jgi:hypothetical protein
MAIERFSIDGSTAAIFAEPANLAYFLGDDVEADTIGGVEVRTKAIPQRSVRRYKGDPNPYTVGAVAAARYLFDPGRRNGAATPGQEMILSDATETRSFTYSGSWVDVHAFLLGNAARDFTAYSASASYEILATDGQATPLKKK